MFIVLKGEICSLKSTFDGIHAYLWFVVYFCAFWYTYAFLYDRCLSREI